MLTRCCSPPENVAGGSGQRRLGQIADGTAVKPRGSRAASALETGLLRRGGDDIERGDARDDAQELADIADDAPSRIEITSLRAGVRDVETRVAVGEQDAPASRRDNCRSRS